MSGAPSRGGSTPISRRTTPKALKPLVEKAMPATTLRQLPVGRWGIVANLRSLGRSGAEAAQICSQQGWLEWSGALRRDRGLEPAQNICCGTDLILEYTRLVYCKLRLSAIRALGTTWSNSCQPGTDLRAIKKLSRETFFLTQKWYCGAGANGNPQGIHAFCAL